MFARPGTHGFHRAMDPSPTLLLRMCHVWIQQFHLKIGAGKPMEKKDRGGSNHQTMDWFSRENLNRKPMGFYHQIDRAQT